MAVDNYVFLSGLDKTYNGRIRAHVLRKHHNQMQQRRQGVVASRTRGPPQQSTTKSSPKKYTTDQQELQNTLCQQISVLPESAWERGTSDCPRARTTSRRMSQSDVSRSSSCDIPSLRNDVQNQSNLTSWSPFDTLSTTVSMRERYLVYHFVHSSKSLLYQTDSSQILFQPPRDIAFRQLVHHRDGRIAMAATAAYKVAFYTSGQAGEEALRLETQLMELLQQRLMQSPPCIDDISILLIIAFISRDSEAFAAQTMDERRGKVLQGHIRGLREIIVRRGGLPKLSHNPSVSFHLHLSDLITAGEISVGLTPLSQYFTIGADVVANLPHHNVNQPEHDNLEHKIGYELVGLYASFHGSSHSKDHQPPSATAHLLRLCLYQTLPLTSPLLKELSRPGDGDSPVFARLNVLIHLADLLLSLHRTADQPSILSTFEQLREFIDQQGLNRTPCLCVLSWVLMVRQAGFQLASPPRIWLASRILWLAKRLDVTFVRRVEDMLFSLLFPDAFLFLGERDEARQPERVWDAQEFADLLWRQLRGK
ncbi:hypothetical protein H2200_005799 [Cladophialophora chaetospira]|uniref:Uncharacterized protein n=1 Tax=Cladophialophora chaetospira TaxID=386627 RepID=A0AA38X9R1_9EURO|nr:hypothetical protein H2200_005799 [Cladophialophora chaetospira]